MNEIVALALEFSQMAVRARRAEEELIELKRRAVEQAQKEPPKDVDDAQR